MTLWFRHENGLVAEDPVDHGDVDPNEAYAPNTYARVPQGATVQQRMTWNGEKLGPIAPEPPARLMPVISYRQFGEGLWHDEIITYEQYLAFVKTGDIPPEMMALLDTLPDDDTGKPTPRKVAIGLVAGATEYALNNPLVDIVRQAHGWTVDELHEHWRVWQTL